MSSVQLENGRDVIRDRALLRDTKRRVKEEIEQRTSALVRKYLATPSNTAVDLYPGSDTWELHSRSGALTFVRGATEILTATESPPGSNKWVITYEAPEAQFVGEELVDLRDDRAIPETTVESGPD